MQIQQTSFNPKRAESSPPVVTIEHLNYFFGQGVLRKQVLFDIHLTIDPGEIVLMTGPSGSGKTTLLTLIGGLRSVQGGSVVVLGQEFRDASKHSLRKVRSHIGYIFQAHHLLKSLTARQNVELVMELHETISDETVHDLTEAIFCEVGLSDRMDYYPENLSGGQQQRVAIARALVSRPTLVLADEPTAALDSKSGRDVVDIMQQLAKEQGCTILMVTHDSRILDIADRIVHLEDGCLKRA
ncbi:MAG: DevA family ABC transporter ATP-binding protein [Leptolyngbyaceae cyanobacterium MO_188.B28]|nr:DevA family ABC transporter ATP-binding protein [Leptolyngbyaceae cyanobacterium MO_188.B28]